MPSFAHEMGEPSDPPPKSFTVEEADALLPKVRPLVEQLQALYRSITKTNQDLDETTRKLSGGNGYPLQALRERLEQLTRHQLQLVESFQSALNQLEELGGLLKDLNLGLVDFYGLRQGEMICLCWKLGEERIRFWHTLEEGYVGRKPLQ